jgi:hypothetical protein
VKPATFQKFDPYAFLREQVSSAQSELSQLSQLSQRQTPLVEDWRPPGADQIDQDSISENVVGHSAPGENETSTSAKVAKPAKVDSGGSTPSEGPCPRGESAAVFVPALARELWLASDLGEANRLRTELADEGDDRPVLRADDIVKLAGQPSELVVATVRTLITFTGSKVVDIGPAPGVPDKCSAAVAAMTTPGIWSTEASSTITWFETAREAGQLPTESFQLEPWIRIADPAKWYTTLCRDIGAGAKGPRAGALVEGLRLLRQILEGDGRRELERIA